MLYILMSYPVNKYYDGGFVTERTWAELSLLLSPGGGLRQEERDVCRGGGEMAGSHTGV